MSTPISVSMKKQLPSGISSGGSFFRPSFELVRENAIFAKLITSPPPETRISTKLL